MSQERVREDHPGGVATAVGRRVVEGSKSKTVHLPLRQPFRVVHWVWDAASGGERQHEQDMLVSKYE